MITKIICMLLFMISLLILVSLSVVKINTQQQTANENINFTSYNNTELGIYLQYPANWSKMEEKFDANVDVISFISTPENDTDTFTENVNIAIEPLQNESITLEEYSNTTLAALSNVFENFSLISKENTNLDGVPAIKIIFSITQPQITDQSRDIDTIKQIPMKIMQILSVKEGKAYVIIYSAEEAKYDDYLPIIEKMIGVR
jgi:eukaryotic-like serine/threonine-protein kinase